MVVSESEHPNDIASGQWWRTAPYGRPYELWNPVYSIKGVGASEKEAERSSRSNDTQGQNVIEGNAETPRRCTTNSSATRRSISTTHVRDSIQCPVSITSTPAYLCWLNRNTASMQISSAQPQYQTRPAHSSSKHHPRLSILRCSAALR